MHSCTAPESASAWTSTGSRSGSRGFFSNSVPLTSTNATAKKSGSDPDFALLASERCAAAGADGGLVAVDQKHFAVAAVAALALHALAARRECRPRGLLLEIVLERHAIQRAPRKMTIQARWSERIRRPSRKAREIVHARDGRREFHYGRRLPM